LSKVLWINDRDHFEREIDGPYSFGIDQKNLSVEVGKENPSMGDGRISQFGKVFQSPMENINDRWSLRMF
jgi:hypothetical protein